MGRRDSDGTGADDVIATEQKHTMWLGQLRIWGQTSSICRAGANEVIGTAQKRAMWVSQLGAGGETSSSQSRTKRCGFHSSKEGGGDVDLTAEANEMIVTEQCTGSNIVIVTEQEQPT